jgi:hypothetical protein
MIKISLSAMAVAAVTMVSLLLGECGGGPTGDDNPRPPTPTGCTKDAAGNLDCPLQTGRG